MKPNNVRHDPVFMREHWESEATGYVLERRFSAVDAKVVETLQLKSGEKLLEIGFGSCVTAPVLLKTYPGVYYYGLDLADRFIESATSRLPGPAYFAKASAAQLPFAAGCFDAILEMDAIHHFPREYLPGIVAEMARAARPGGRMLVVEDWAASPENERDRLAHELQRRRFLTRRGLEYHPGESEWIQMFEQANLSLLDLTHVRRPLILGRLAELRDEESQRQLVRLQALWNNEPPTTVMSLFLSRKD